MIYTSAFKTENNTEIVYIPGHPRQYCFDVQTGHFKIGNSRLTKAKLPMEVLSWYVEYDALDVLFIDTYNTVSHIVFGNKHLENFWNLTTRYSPLAAGITIAHIITPSQLDFEWYPSHPERFRKIQAFASKHLLTLKSVQLPQI